MLQQIINFLGWTSLIGITFVFIIVLGLFFGGKIYCCKCGKGISREKDMLVGGSASYGCSRCDKRLDVCHDLADRAMPLRFWNPKRYLLSFVYLTKRILTKAEELS